MRTIRKNEAEYYELLMDYSRQHLMLFPYHLSDVVVRGLRTTPFAYYSQMMQDIMNAERSYDSLPNFAAADCLRLLGIGRNQYIDLMNQCRSTKVVPFILAQMTTENVSAPAPVGRAACAPDQHAHRALVDGAGGRRARDGRQGVQRRREARHRQPDRRRTAAVRALRRGRHSE